MRATRRTPDEQFQLITECRQSGLSDHMWCVQHDINPGTFWNWINRLRKQGYIIPKSNSTMPELAAPQKQEVVKLDLFPGQASSFAQEATCISTVPEKSMVESPVAIEIQFGRATIRITNHADEHLVHMVLRSIGGETYAG